MILHHHEWYNGKGYPDKLRGENIPLGARIISIADAYDTMTTLRPYRKSLVKNEAIEELKRCSGTQFDPKLTELFCRAINEAS
jgi:HD-GYP domain-containing protein (c-di-GMP phosphodiesterase class II)